MRNSFVLENLGELPQLIPVNHSHILGYVTKKCSHNSQTPILRIQGPAQSRWNQERIAYLNISQRSWKRKYTIPHFGGSVSRVLMQGNVKSNESVAQINGVCLCNEKKFLCLVHSTWWNNEGNILLGIRIGQTIKGNHLLHARPTDVCCNRSENTFFLNLQNSKIGVSQCLFLGTVSRSSACGTALSSARTWCPETPITLPCADCSLKYKPPANSVLMGLGGDVACGSHKTTDRISQFRYPCWSSLRTTSE